MEVAFADDPHGPTSPRVVDPRPAGVVTELEWRTQFVGLCLQRRGRVQELDPIGAQLGEPLRPMHQLRQALHAEAPGAGAMQLPDCGPQEVAMSFGNRVEPGA